MENSKVIIGIDIGMKGGISLLSTKDCSIIELIEMPVIKNDKKYKQRFNKFVDVNKLYGIISTYHSTHGVEAVVIEDIGNIYGIDKFSMYSLGRQRGLIEGLCNCIGVKVVDYKPKVWQGYMFAKIDKVVDVNATIKKTKIYALEVFKKLYPHLVTKVMKRKNPKDGLIDATLIGRFYWEMNNDKLKV
jgi:hypothetical protein